MIHQGDHIIGKRIEAEFFDGAQRSCFAVSTTIQSQQAETGWQFKEGEHFIDCSSQPVLEEKRRSSASFEVVEAKAVAVEEWHRVSSWDGRGND